MGAQKIWMVILVMSLWEGYASAAPPIKMGYFRLPPFQYISENEGKAHHQGAAIVYFEAAAGIMGEKVNWVGPLPLLRLIKDLKTGQLDGTVGFYRSPKAEAYLYFAASPVFLAQPILMVRKDNPATAIRSIDDIQGYRIGHIVTAGGRYTPLLDTHPEAIILEGLGGDQWAEQNLQKLLAGRLDAVFERQPYTLPFVAAKMHLYTQVKILLIPDPPSPMYVVFSKASQRGRALIERYNEIIPQLEENYADLARQEVDAAIAHDRTPPNTSKCNGHGGTDYCP